MHEWVPLLDRFDDFLQLHCSSRKDLALDFMDDSSDPPLSESDIIAVLRASNAILENCTSRQLYGSMPQLTALLAAESSALVLQVLKVFLTLFSRTSNSLPRVSAQKDTLDRLVVFIGKGPPEPNLECLASGKTAAAQPPAEFSIEFDDVSVKEDSRNSRSGAESESAKRTVTIAIAGLPERDAAAMQAILQQHEIPEKEHFGLLMKLRTAREVPTTYGLQQRARIWLHAYSCTILGVSSNDALTMATIENTPTVLVRQIADALKADSGIPDDIQTLLLKVLTLQVCCKRQSGRATVIGHSLLNHSFTMPFTYIIFFLIIKLQITERDIRSVFIPPTMSSIGSGRACSLAAVLIRQAVASLTGVEETTQQHSPQYVEALILLFTAMLSNTSGVPVAMHANLVPTLLPLIKDTDPHHVWAVTKALALIERLIKFKYELYKFIDYVHTHCVP